MMRFIKYQGNNIKDEMTG